MEQLATVTPIESRRLALRMELVDSLFVLALADSAELELAIKELEPYDVNRFALVFAAVDAAAPA